MTRSSCKIFLLATAFLAAVPVRGLELLPADSPVQASIHGTLDLETYWSGGRPPGLLFTGDQVFFQPRATIFTDIHFGKHVLASVQARFDRGFDPGGNPDGRASLDEYFLRWTLFDRPVLNFQIGKFATSFGAWVPRHLSWDNPFVTAPLPYENIAVVGDHAAPPSRPQFLSRHSQPDNKPAWLPLIWGPSYSSGASIFGRTDHFDYAFEVKNAGLSSRPRDWPLDRVGLDEPAWTGRLGWRPNAAWNLGVSGSRGPYLTDDPDHTLPPGTSRGDFKQSTLGIDAGYAHHHFELWSEVLLSRFDVARTGNADSLAYFIEAKYKLTPSLFTALRWNQQFFNRIPLVDGGADTTRWDRDIFRIDWAVGWRLSRNVQLKAQYSYGHESGANHNADHLLATQVTFRF